MVRTPKEFEKVEAMSDGSSVRASSKSAFQDRALQEQIIFFVGVMFVLIVPAAIALFAANLQAAWLALVSGAFITLMSKFSGLAELSLGPLKARMREAVAEANATIDQLRDLATSTTSAFLTHLIATSFMGGMSNERRFRMHDELMEQLKSMGVSREQLKRADAEWRGGVGVIYHRIIASHIMKEYKPTPERNDDVLRLEIGRLLDFPNLRTSPPDDFEAFCR